MRIGIIRIGREKDGDAFGRELAALVDAGYSVAAGTGELVVVRVGDVCGADAGETAKAVFAAARAKLAGRSVVIAVSDEQVRASLASAFADDTAVRVTSEAFASAVMGLEIKEKVSGRATMSASAYHSAAFGGTGVSRTVDAEGYILKILRLCAPGERLGISLVQRKLGLGFPLAAKLFDMMYERGYLKTRSASEGGGATICLTEAEIEALERGEQLGAETAASDEDARAAESTEAAAEEPAETPEESAEELDSQTAEEGGDALGADAADEAEEEDELPFAEDDDEREDEPEDDVAPEEEEESADETDSENCGQEESDEESEEESDDELEDESEEGPEEELDEEPEEDVPYDSDYVGLFSIDDLDDEDDEEEDDEDEEYGDDEDDDEAEDDESEEYESEDDEDEEEDEEE